MGRVLWEVMRLRCRFVFKCCIVVLAADALPVLVVGW